MIGVLIKTHILNRQVLERTVKIANDFGEINFVDVILSVDATRYPANIRESLPRVLPGIKLHFFDSKVHQKLGFPLHPMVSGGKAQVNWFHSDYSLIDFYMQNRGSYDILWQIEYDVYLRSGSWKFLEFDYGVDFMASSIKIREPQYKSFVQNDCILQPNWPWWDKLANSLACVGCFFPCIRLSAEAIESLICSYQKGICGFGEVSVPSLLAMGDFTISSLAIVNENEARIFHPHWYKLYKKDFSKDFQLNSVDLFIE